MTTRSAAKAAGAGPVHAFLPHLAHKPNVDTDFPFVNETELGIAFKSQAPQPPRTPKLTVAVDVGNGDCGFAFYLDLNNSLQQPVNRGVMKTLINSHNVLTRDFVGRPNNAGNLPKEETLVAIERLKETRDRCNVEELSTGVHTPDAAVPSNRIIKIGNEARTLFLNEAEQKKYDFYTDFKRLYAPENRQRSGRVADDGRYVHLAAQDVTVQSITSSVRVYVSTLYAIILSTAVSLSLSKVAEENHQIIDMADVKLVVTHPDHYDQLAADLMASTACMLRIALPIQLVVSGGGSAAAAAVVPPLADTGALFRHQVVAVREGLASFLSQFATSDVAIGLNNVVLSGDVGHRTLDMTAMVVRSLEPLQLQVLVSQGVNLGGVLVEDSMMRMIEDNLLVVENFGHGLIPRPKLRSSAHAAASYRFVVRNLLQQMKATYNSQHLVQTYAGYWGLLPAQKDKYKLARGMPLELASVAAVPGVPQPWITTLNAYLPTLIGPAGRQLPAQVLHRSADAPLPEISDYDGSADEYYQFRRGTGVTDITVPPYFVKHHLTQHSVRILEVFDSLLEQIKSMKVEAAHAQVVVGGAAAAAAPATTRVDVILLSGNGASNCVHHETLDEALKTRKLPQGEQRLVHHVPLDSVHVIQGGVLAGLYADRLITQVTLKGAYGVRIFCPWDTLGLLGTLKEKINIPDEDFKRLHLERVQGHKAGVHLLLPLDNLGTTTTKTVNAGVQYGRNSFPFSIVQPGKEASLDVFNVDFDIPEVVHEKILDKLPIVVMWDEEGEPAPVIPQKYALDDNHRKDNRNRSFSRIIRRTAAVMRLTFTNTTADALSVRLQVCFDCNGAVSGQVENERGDFVSAMAAYKPIAAPVDLALAVAHVAEAEAAGEGLAQANVALNAALPPAGGGGGIVVDDGMDIE